MNRFTRIALASAVLGALAIPAQAAQRAYVASYGSDANTASSCTFAAPCRGFTAAHSVVDAGGEIIALDTAGYGAVTITKSVSIIGSPGFYVGVAAGVGDGVTIATPGVSVTLRGLNINGVGGVRGINASAGARLNIEDCVVSNFASDGILVADVAKVRILNTIIRGNGNGGINVGANVAADVSNTQILDNGWLGIFMGGASTLAVSDSVISGNAWGLGTSAGTTSVIRTTASGNANAGFETEGGSMTVGSSMASSNGTYGLVQGAGTFGSMGNNMSIGNGLGATSGTITAVPGV